MKRRVVKHRSEKILVLLDYDTFRLLQKYARERRISIEEAIVQAIGTLLQKHRNMRDT